jgi:hypothetical protein
VVKDSGASVGNNTLEERDRLRRFLASMVYAEAKQRVMQLWTKSKGDISTDDMIGLWADAKTELHDLIDMLGLREEFDPLPGTEKRNQLPSNLGTS